MWPISAPQCAFHTVPHTGCSVNRYLLISIIYRAWKSFDTAGAAHASSRSYATACTVLLVSGSMLA